MATPVPITIPENIAPPNDGDIHLKHVEFYGESKTEYRIEYRKLEKTQFFVYLRRTESCSFHERLMTVTFKKPTLQAENGTFNFCKDVLNRSIFCEGKHYRFLGHSESQIREKTCYLMNGSDEEIHDLLAKFVDFDQITNVGLRAKAIGLLFATFDKLLELAEDDVNIKPGIKSNCGFMYSPFFTLLRDQLEGVNYPEPSAVLVRYGGFESMLVLKKESTNVSHQKVQFHKSMPQKFATPDEDVRQAMSFICIADHSRPYTTGYLDLRLITFLVARRVSVEQLKIRQNDYFDLLKRMCTDSSTAKLFLRMTGQNEHMNNADLITLRRSEIEKMIDYSHKAGYKPSKPPVVRTRILVPKARMVFGVCDPYNKLKNDECYFKPTLPYDESKEFAAKKKVVVACNPYYHPGDIRVLKLTHEKCGYENLVDCLVLPLKELRGPQASECAGGELSGIKFFLSWDTHLIPEENMKPWSHMPTNGESISDEGARCWPSFLRRGFPLKSEKENRDEMIEYFASFTDDLPNRIDKIYAKFARSFGPSSEECEQLSRMLYQAANFTVDRDLLREKLKKFEQMEQTRTASSANGSSTDEDEGCLRGWFHRTPLLICPDDEVWKDFDERTERFVKEVQEEHYCD